MASDGMQPALRFARWARWAFLVFLLVLGAYVATPASWQPHYTTVTVAAGAWWAASMVLRRARSPPSARRWLVLGLGTTALALGETAWAIAEVGFGRSLPALSLADAAYYGGYGLLLAGLVMWMPREGRSARHRLLEAYLMAAALALVVWALVFRGVVSVAGPRDWAGIVVSGYPVSGAFLLAFAVVLTLSLPPSRRRGPWLLTAAFFLWGVADTGYAYQEAHGGFESGSLLDLAWLGAYGCLGLAPLAPERDPRRRLFTFLDRLTAPHSSLQTLSAKRQARLAAATSLALLAILGLAFPVFRARDPLPDPFWQEPANLVTVALMALLAASYLLSRSRRSWSASVLLATTLEAGLVTAALLNAAGPFGEGMLFVLVLPPLVATLLVSPLSGLALSIGNAVVAFVLASEPGVDVITAYLAMAILIALGAILALGSSAWRKDLDDTESALASIHETQAIAQVGSWELDPATGEHQATPENDRLFGFAPGEARTREGLLAHLHPDDLPRTEGFLQRVLQQGHDTIDLRFTGPSGMRWVRNKVVARRDDEGEPVRVVGFSQDITAEKLREEQAAESERLRRETQFKTQFLNMAAHELANPLTPLKLQLATLRHHAAHWSPPEQRSIDLLERNVQRLGVFVSDLLDAARLQGGRLRIAPAPTSLRSLVQNTHGSLEAQAQEGGIRLGLDLPDEEVQATVDGNRLSQVLFNLTHNALKFTPREGHVTLRLRREGDEAVLAVEDSGIGLEPDQIQRLFQPFMQVHDPGVVRAGGTGLGLYISRGIVEQHGGTLEATSPGRGQGSTFSVRIPLAGPPAAPTAP
jgi:signal transduction histidine kinase